MWYGWAGEWVGENRRPSVDARWRWRCRAPPRPPFPFHWAPFFIRKGDDGNGTHSCHSCAKQPMPRLTKKTMVLREHVTTARLTFFEWVQSLASVTSTPQRGNRAPRLKKLRPAMRETLLDHVDQKDDDPLVRMFDVHMELQTLYTTALAFVDTSSTGHGTNLKALHTLVVTGVTVDGSAGGASGASNTLTKTNYEALKTKAHDEMTTQLKEGHKAFPHIVRFLELMDTLLLDGKCDARSCGLRSVTMSYGHPSHTLLHLRPFFSPFDHLVISHIATQRVL